MIEKSMVEDLEIFENFTDEEFKVFLENVDEIELREKEALFKEGDTGSEMYVVLSGEVDVLKERGVSQPQLLATIPEGSIIGEMTLIDQGERSATIRASEGQRVRLMVLTRKFLDELSKEYMELACKFMLNVIKYIAGRSRLTMNHLIYSVQTLKNLD
jgi:CRP-like cAMP-binding protein